MFDMNWKEFFEGIALLLNAAWYWVLLLAALAAGYIYALTLKWRPRK